MVDFSEMPELGTLSATTVLAWYAWHTTYHTIPNLVSAFRDEVAAMRRDCIDEREALHAELDAERKQRHEHHLMVLGSLRELADRISATRGGS